MAETGLILKGVGGFYTVLNDRGEEVVCRARGRFRKDGISPVVGDRVEYLNDGEGRYYPRYCQGRTCSFAPLLQILISL